MRFKRVCFVVMFLALNSVLFSAGNSHAVTTVTATGGAAAMVQNQAAVIVDSGVTVVNDLGNITGGTVSITSGFASGDTLACTNSGLITCSYNATTGILTFTGTDTPANWQAIFRTVTIATTSSSTTARTVAFTIGSAIPYSGNGHFYEYVSTTGTWTAGKAAAAARTLFGLQGYLATITSQAENDFVQQKLGADAWIGASDEFSQINTATGATTYVDQVAAEGHWYWVTGPVGEIGTNFSNGNTSPVVVGGQYMNWNAGEPNNWGGAEHYGEIYCSGGSPGRWNDLLGGPLGYVVEYGGMAGDPAVTMTASKTVNNTASYTVTYNGNTNTGGSAPVDGSSPYASGVTVTVLGNTGSLVKTGYTFANWNTAANGTGTAYAAAATFTIAANTTLYAQWTINTYTVTPSAGAGGTINPSTPQTVNYNATTTFTVTPNAGYTASVGGTCGGALVGTTYTTNAITANCTVSASFTLNTYTVTTTATNGTITSTNNPTVNYGSTTTVTGSATTGYYFTGVSGCGGTAQNNTNQTITTFSYTTGAITSACTVTANFAIDTFAVNFASGGNGTLTGTASQTINYGSSATAVTAVPATGYHFVNWTGTGGFVTTTANPLTVTNVTAAQTITANFAIDTFAISFVSGGNGTLTGTASQTINYGSSATAVTAVPATNYHFVNWTGTGGFVTTTANSLTVTNVTAAQTITANFAIDTFAISFVSGGNGTLTGTASQTINYGGSATAVTAVPATGYHFVNWTGTGGFVTTTANSLTVTNVTAAQTITANFAIDTFAISFVSGGNGTLTGTASQTINYGSSATAVTAIPGTNYHFVNWTGTGGFVTTTANPLTVTNVTAAQTITANFAIDTFAVSFASGGNGTLTGTASQTINYGSSATAVTAIPATNYHFVNWTGTGGFVTTTANPLTVTNVTATQTITANFVIDTYTVTTTATNGTITSTNNPTVNHGSTTTVTGTATANYYFTGVSGCGGTAQNNTNQATTTFSYTTGAITGACTVTATFAIKSYTVTPSSGANGTISPNTAQTVNHGSTKTFTVTPNTGYTASVGGTCGGTLIGTTYTTSAIIANCTVSASFTLNTYTVTPSAGAGGTISPSTPQTINYNATTTFTVTPNAGYTASVGGTCSGTLIGTTYTTSAIIANCTVSASFTLNTYTVTPSAGAGGTISPSTPQTINYNATNTFTVTPNTGYTASVGGTCGGTLVGTTYTTNAIIANCTVVAGFSQNSYRVTPSAGTGGSISPSTPQTVNSGATAVFTVTPNSGYTASVIGTCGGALVGTTYTTNAIRANCTVTASFTINTVTARVTASAGTNGSISPTGVQTVTYGSTTAFTLTPNSGYTATVGGTCGGSLVGNTYTTTAITADCTVVASFTAVAGQNVCTYSLTPTSQAFDVSGGTGTVNVTKSSTSCVWLATSNATWITLNSGSIGDSSSTVNFTVAANTSAARTGTLTISGQTFTVAQAGLQHTLTLTKSGTGAGKGLINNSDSVLLCGADCQVAVLQYDAGLAVTLAAAPETGTTFNGWSGGGCAGTGACTVTLNEDTSVNAVFSSATAATTDSSTSTLTTNGNEVNINVPIIKYTDSSGSTTYYSTAFVYVPTSDSKIWVKLTSLNVVTDLAPYSGTQMSEMYNSGSDLMLHLNNITINGAYIWADLKNMQKNDGNTWFVLTGYGANTQNTCTYSISPAGQSVDSSGGTGTISVTASSNDCTWTAASNAAWITLTSENSGSGNITLSFTADSNSGAARTGTLTIAGQTFTVTQAGIQYSLTLTKSGTGAGKGLINNSDNALLCGADCELAVLKYEAGTTLTLSATPEAGSTFNGWNGEACPETGACTLTLTLNGDTSINAVFSSATAPATDSSTTTVATSGNDISINVPVIKYTDNSGSTTYYSTAFVYVPTSDNKIWVKLTSLNVVTDLAPYSGAQMSELYYSGSNLRLHLNNITINGAYLWADLEYMPTNDGQYWFVVTGSGEN